MDRLIRRQCNASCKFRVYVRIVSDLAKRQLDDTLTESLVCNVCDVVNLKTLFAFRTKQVLATQLNTRCAPTEMCRSGLQYRTVVLMLLKILGVGVTV